NPSTFGEPLDASSAYRSARTQRRGCQFTTVPCGWRPALSGTKAEPEGIFRVPGGSDAVV
ncbi:hypothetical protein BGW80DRAFT_1282461, partial [Lactifluus volemus]